LFDQYLIFRPDFISNWKSGQETHWQAALWREIAANLKGEPPPLAREKFKDAIAKSNTALEGLPERLFVFGISALPPFHMEVLEAVAKKIDVHFFLLQPCREYWGYILSEREIEKSLKKQRKRASEATSLYLERGNRLLASMGKLGRD